MEKPAFESVVLDATESIRVLQFSCPAFQSNHTWHFHAEYELSLIVKGSGKCFIGDHISAFYPGDLVLIGPNIPHCWISNDEATENEMFVVQFERDFLGSSFYNIPESQSVKRLLGDSNKAIAFEHYGDEVRQLLTAMRTSNGLQRIAELMLVCDKLSRCQQQMLASDGYSIEKDVRGADRLTIAINYVKEHLHEEIKQPHVASLVHMAPQSFSRFFRAQTGRTFVSFVNEIRIAEACHLLATTDKDILYIALNCGYGNNSHFNRKFLENKKITPSAFRESQRLKARLAESNHQASFKSTNDKSTNDKSTNETSTNNPNNENEV